MVDGVVPYQGQQCIHIMVIKATMKCSECGKTINYQEIVDCYQEIENQQAFIRCSMVANTLQNIKNAVYNPCKVILFLDIDKTFVYANVVQRTYQKEQYCDVKLCQDLYQRTNNLTEYYQRLSKLGYQYMDEIEGKILVINFRPGFFDFLTKNYTKIVIVIYTLSKLEYASKVVQILDPKLQLVYRIIARREPGVCVKNVNSILHQDTCLLKQCLIFDDSSVPWAPAVDEKRSQVTFIRSISYYGPNNSIFEQKQTFDGNLQISMSTQGQLTAIDTGNDIDNSNSIQPTSQELFVQDLCAFQPEKNYLDICTLQDSISLWESASRYKDVENCLLSFLQVHGRLLKRFKRPSVSIATMAALYDAQYLQLQSLSMIVTELRERLLKKPKASILAYTPNPPLFGFRFAIWPSTPGYYILKTASHQIIDVIDFINRDTQAETEINDMTFFNYTVQLITDLGGGVFAENNILCDFQIIEWEQLKQQRTKFQNDVLKEIWNNNKDFFYNFIQNSDNQHMYQVNGFLCYILVFGQFQYENAQVQAFVDQVKPQIINVFKTFYVDLTYLHLCGYMYWRQDEFWWMWHFIRCLFDDI